MTSLPAEILERRSRAKAWFETLQRRICAALEELEREAPDSLYAGGAGRFDFRPWTRETGEGGGVGGFLAGRLFEKAAVHTSAALARFSPEMAATTPGAERDPSYVSASISLIVHPRSPRVPTVHMNTRFLSTAESWFGGGADLTPMLDAQRSQQADDAVLFHAAMKGACDAFDPIGQRRRDLRVSTAEPSGSSSYFGTIGNFTRAKHPAIRLEHITRVGSPLPK